MPSLDNPPGRIRSGADMHSVWIRVPATWNPWMVLIGFLNLMLCGGVAAIEGTTLLDAAFGAILIGNVLLWWIMRRTRVLNVVLDSNILDVRRAGFGAHYRIPLVDVLDVTLQHHASRHRTILLPSVTTRAPSRRASARRS